MSNGSANNSSQNNRLSRPLESFAEGLRRRAEEQRLRASELEEQRFQNAYNEHKKQFEELGHDPFTESDFRERIYNPLLAEEKARLQQQSHARVNNTSGAAARCA